MSKLLTINVKNNQPQTQSFYFFQQPAIYAGGRQVYSNSLFSMALGSYSQTGAILTFQANLQYYAAIQQANTPPQVGQQSGFASASRAIDLAGSGSPNDWTTATVSPLGLSAPVNGPGVQPGAFRITTPSFNPWDLYNVGSALAVNGGIVLSNFVQANPMYNIDCQPILKYFVQTGSYTPGTVMNFTQSSVNAALADFTSGHTTCNVTLNVDGTWSTQFQ
ncbi:hypothetical protein [Rhizobium sp. P44RR-XXIV]|uniref:hypothetical protein n=1 Tax=Rhizobium sp. P44RR-XXIV TaxID=1921145 RepID=UPI00098553D0|nr:hypothetical protein [Rhizobium sp. P44RR-XXIV]TIX90138.1 hypothetical protein BSK43_012515 [Rhizobium sp. P44RR-XXIV]